jgi:signal peptidase I
MNTIQKRRMWLSPLLSLVTPGLGQLYNAQWKKACIFFVIYIGIALSITKLFVQFSGLFLWGCLIIGFYLFMIGDAMYTSWKLRTITLTRYNRWYIYGIIWIGHIILSNIAMQHLIPFHAYKISSKGMLSTIQVGDRIIIDKTHYRHTFPAREDIIVFRYPADRSRIFIQRVIGLSDETLEIRDKNVMINTIPIQENYIQHIDKQILPQQSNPRDNLPPTKIPSRAVFVMGDNRDSSLDSRFWGFLDIQDIQGKVLYIYWSQDRTRIGRQVQ